MSSSKTVYKKISMTAAKDRTLIPLTPAMKTKVDTVVSNFITYLKAAHS